MSPDHVVLDATEDWTIALGFAPRPVSETPIYDRLAPPTTRSRERTDSTYADAAMGAILGLAGVGVALVLAGLVNYASIALGWWHW